MNKRQLETLASAGAFDGIEANRAGVHAVAETVLAIAARTHEGRTSGQGGLFGETEVAGDAIKLPSGVRWTLSQRMEQEKEAFGFYFSAHPVDRHAHIAKMHGARTYTSLTELIIPDDGARIGATMAALVEDARWRTSARGKRYMMAQLSDATGQFTATCFDDSVAADLEKAAKEGDCALITVELDRRPGEEAPRVSIKRVQLFDGLASMAKFVVEVTVTDKAAFPALRAMLDPLRNGRGEVRARIVGGWRYAADAWAEFPARRRTGEPYRGFAGREGGSDEVVRGAAGFGRVIHRAFAPAQAGAKAQTHCTIPACAGVAILSKQIFAGVSATDFASILLFFARVAVIAIAAARAIGFILVRDLLRLSLFGIVDHSLSPSGGITLWRTSAILKTAHLADLWAGGTGWCRASADPD